MRVSTLSILSFAGVALGQTPSLADLLASQPDLSTLLGAIQTVPDFVATLSEATNVTILAPTNSAFEALLAGEESPGQLAVKEGLASDIQALVSYHIIKGQYASTNFSKVPTFLSTLFSPSNSIDGVTVPYVAGGQDVGLVLAGGNATILSGELASSNVVEADITAIPGVTIHKIDTVLTIPLNLSSTLPKVTQAQTSSALAAVVAANLAETLDTVSDLTIFIPNDAAFAAIAPLLANATVDAVSKILEYHAVTGAVVFSSDIANSTVATAQGGNLTLTVGSDGTVFINDARVVLPNIILSNGVAHIIDQVLNPDQSGFSPETPGYPTASASSTGTPTASGTATSSTSQFTGAAAALQGAFGGAIAAAGLALML